MTRRLNIKNARKVFKSIVKNKFFIAIPIFFVFALVVVGCLAFYFITFNGKIYPNIKIGGVDIGNNSLSDSIYKLSENIDVPLNLTLRYQDQSFNIKTSDIDFFYNYQTSSEIAYKLTRTGNFYYDLSKRINLLFHPENLELSINVNDQKLLEKISDISKQISVNPRDPFVTLTDGKITIDKGSPGKEINQEILINSIYSALSSNNTSIVDIPVETVDHSLNQSAIDNLYTRVEKIIGKSIVMKFEYSSFNLKDGDIVKLLDPISGYKDSSLLETIQKISTSVNRDPQNPKFVFENNRVTEFQPALDGVKIDNEKFKSQLVTSLDSLEKSDEKTINFDIPVTKTPPDVSTDKVNDLGIKELIGRGTSTYYHSIPGRVHNVVLAASKINGTLVKPGQTFSFNQTLGDVSAFTGYQQAYIISEGKTILGDGGGVCQVSTTLFRALLNAGLPIDERQAHAYRVGYYEQDSSPGLDATVYSPSPDLKFTNDTSSYILIEATANPKNYSLVFELYGTSDGRIATISKPIVTNVTAPPADLYQDDPTLKMGVIKQIDFKAWGAKVTFNYSVKKDGQEIYKKTFISNYRPWQAIYLRGTGPAQ